MMTDQEIRIAVAECCGWKHGTKEESSFRDPSKKIQSDSWISPNGFPERKLPDYCEDLNAMHEAESILVESNGKMPQKWYNIYIAICDNDNGKAMRGTARQRAKAFLCYYNKWVE